MFIKYVSKIVISVEGDCLVIVEFGKDFLVVDGDFGFFGLNDFKNVFVKNKFFGLFGGDDVFVGLFVFYVVLVFCCMYSLNLIKVRNVEVNLFSFDKIKFIGKGDVGKVYFVWEKKSS